MNIQLQKHQKVCLSTMLNVIISDHKDIDIENDPEIKAVSEAYEKHFISERGYTVEKAREEAKAQPALSTGNLYFFGDLFKKEGDDFSFSKDQSSSLLSVINVFVNTLAHCIVDFEVTKQMGQLKGGGAVKITLPNLVVVVLKNYISYIIEKSKSVNEDKFQEDYFKVMSKMTNLSKDEIIERAKTMKKRGEATSLECLSVFESQPEGDFVLTLHQAELCMSVLKASSIDFLGLHSSILRKIEIANNTNIN
jgi:hypothetical protein